MAVSDEVALHPCLSECMKMFQAGEVAIIQDVGYPHPNLSHFESTAIWDSANLQGTSSLTGWYGEVVMHNHQAFDNAHFDAAAITFDKNLSFAGGDRVPVLPVSQNVAAILRDGTATRAITQMPGTTMQLAALVNEGIAVRHRFATRLAGVQAPQWQPYEEPFEVQTKLTEWFFAHGITTPLVRVNQGGFDTHTELLARHSNLMATFDRGIARLKQVLVSTGTWKDTVIMVHSEFGRRAGENGFGGTDHGSSGPVFLIGGRVRGGIYGQRASLDDLDIEGNLKYTTDFRSVYSTLVDNLWRLPANPFADAGFGPLSIAVA
ncbi:MAG: DUF1501 domain-containing protein [Pseudomonadota bacterium]|nr:DUF1501 domain-containing protein [Pseudomonadota bacterium]